MNANPAATPLSNVAAYETGAYKWYVAATLCVAHAVAMIDRYLMVLVTEPVRATLNLTDTQLGLLAGTGFAVLYCGFALPLGAIADATHRRNLILVGLSAWSLATVAAAFTTTFEALFATRLLVGLGEACLIPASMSLLATYFAPSNLARGTAIFGAGANIGYGLVFVGGGLLLAEMQGRDAYHLAGLTLQPWKVLFVVAGACVIPVLVMILFLREPPRPDRTSRLWASSLESLRNGIGYLWRNFRHYAAFMLVGAMTAVTGYAVASWASSLFVRAHGIAAADAGKMLGLIGFLVGPLGTILGGVLLDHLRAKNVIAPPMIIMAGGCIVALLAAAGISYAPSPELSFVSFGIFLFESTFMIPSLYVGMQMLTPGRFRGIAASFNMMIYTLAGLGVGPTAVGVISDRLHGQNALLHATVIVEVAMTAIILPTVFLARRRYHERVATIQQL